MDADIGPAGRRLPCPIIPTTDVHSKEWDGLLLVTDSTKHLTGPLEFLKAPIEQAKELDGAVGKEVTLIGVTGLSSKRLVSGVCLHIFVCLIICLSLSV
jgi:hypothetical protein